MLRRITLTTCLIAIVMIAKAQTADEIIAKYFENTGGIDKWRAVKTIKREGKSVTPQGEFPVATFGKIPNRTKVSATFQGKEFVQMAYDGTTAWTLNPFSGGTSAVKLDAEQANEVIEQGEQEIQDGLIDYKQKGHVVTLEGQEEVDGVQCFKIKFERNKNNDKDDVTELIYFDTENFVPIMRTSYIRSGPSKGTEINSYLSDYQEVSGLMFPHSLESKISGQSLGKVIITKIEVNGDIDDSVFAFPGN